MRIVYVDEAGISHPKQEPYVTVAAVIVHADTKLVALERHLAKLVTRHIQEEDRPNFIFHAFEIFGGHGIFHHPKDDPAPARYSMAKRLEIAKDLAAIPERFDLPVVFGQVERTKVLDIQVEGQPLSAREQAIGAHVIAYLLCATGVDEWMQERAASNEVCLMIVEDNEEARSLIRDTHRFNQDPTLMAGVEGFEGSPPLKRVKEDPLFQPKRQTSPLVVADFCAYLYKRLLVKSDDQLFLPFWGQLRSKVHGSSQQRPPKKQR